MKRITALLIILPMLLTLSCKKDGKEDNGETPQLGVQVKNAQDLYEVPEHQSVSLDLSVTAAPVSAEAYTITLGANPALVSSYNTANGTSYRMLPSDAYVFSSNSVILPKFSAKSNTCELRLKGEGCDPDVTYLLPVVIDGVKGGSNFQAPDEKAAYIVFKMLAAQQEGNGSATNPYLVADVESFLAINSMLQDDATTYFKLTADIDFADVVFTNSEGENPWKPINSVTDDEDAKAKARKRRIDFNGDNHKISNFKAGGPLFGVLCGSVQNLTLEGFNIDADTDDAATLVGVAGSSDNASDFVLKNVVVKSSTLVNDYKRSGGIVAHMRNGLVENCSADCSVTGNQQAGGLIGRVDGGTIINCSATGSATVDAYYAGGLIGYISGETTVRNCHATGNATSLSGNYTRAGGLIGQIDANATVEKCYATGNIQGEGHMAGGLIGVISSATVDKDNKVYENVNVTVSECYATGNVTLPHDPSSGNWAHAGGLIGTISASPASTLTVLNCYSTGSVTVRRYSGGFIGSTYDKARACKQLTITNGYTTSDITGIVKTDLCGLVLGLNDGASATTPNTITCTGFVAWNTSDRSFSYNNCVPATGNYYGTEGTVSQQAKALNWDESIWDLSGDLPKLKNVK
ncbi:MAG: DUF1735 domain-containing protein [Bacteroidales bacterium]|nr:DUF1735 domain-containing protein [Bacteroidales bacterium]